METLYIVGLSLAAAVLSFILSIIAVVQADSLKRKVRELEETIDELSDETLDEMVDIYNECDSKDLQLLEMVDNLLDVQSSNLRCMKALNQKIDNLADKQEFDAQDLFELFTGFFGEEVDESINSKLPDSEKYPECYGKFGLFGAPCKKAKTCTKAPCKESCPKRGRPAKK